MKIVVVGAGITGLSAAATLKRGGATPIVYETREWIGGNCRDKVMDGILVHQYGGHVLNTNDPFILEFASSFGEGWKEYRVKVVARTSRGLIPIPFNSISESICGKLSDEEIIETIFRPYSEKQWGMTWEELPESVTGRVPLRRLGNNCHYHDKWLSTVPARSYAHWFQAMADGIEVRTSCRNDEWKNERADAVVYTAPLDQYFGYEFGKLRFRSLRWQYAKGERRHFQIINDCTRERHYTRSVDHAHWNDQYAEQSVIGYEFPEEYTGENEPIYPFPSRENEELTSRYTALAEKERQTFFVGRLGTNRYLDMETCIRQGILAAETILGKRKAA